MDYLRHMLIRGIMQEEIHVLHVRSRNILVFWSSTIGYTLVSGWVKNASSAVYMWARSHGSPDEEEEFNMKKKDGVKQVKHFRCKKTIDFTVCKIHLSRKVASEELTRYNTTNHSAVLLSEGCASGVTDSDHASIQSPIFVVMVVILKWSQG